MKKTFSIIKYVGGIALLVVIVILVNQVGAAGTYPQLPTPAGYGYPNLLNTGSVSQAKVGNLALGTTAPGYTPQASLDVKGSMVTDVIGVLNGGWVSQKLKVGGLTQPTTTDSELTVEGSRIRSVILSGTGERTVCADAEGRLKVCATTPPVVITPTCGTANGTTVSTAPTTNLCATGTASTVTGTGPWSWTCTGSAGTTPATCSAQKSSVPPTPINGACGGYMACATGNLINASVTQVPFPSGTIPNGAVNAQNASWQCQGLNGGTTAYCYDSYTCPSGYNITGCFTAGTLITLADGSQKPIEQVTKGEQVRASGGVANEVKEFISHDYEGWIYSINGSKPFVTGMHPMMTTAGWKSFDPEAAAIQEPDVVLAGKLGVGDVLLKDNGATETIKKVSRVWKKIPVYNLMVTGSHEYYASGYQVHNKTTNPYCVRPTSTPSNAVDFCTHYPTANCTYVDYVNGGICSGPGGVCTQLTCPNVPINSIDNLSDYYNATALAAANYDPSNATYHFSGDGGPFGAPSAGFVTVTCVTSTP